MTTRANKLERSACVKGRKPAVGEPEITDAMLAAGIAVLKRWDDGQMASYAEGCRKIVSAALQAAPRDG